MIAFTRASRAKVSIPDAATGCRRHERLQLLFTLTHALHPRSSGLVMDLLSITEKLLVSQAVIEKGTSDFKVISKIVAEHPFIPGPRNKFFTEKVCRLALDRWRRRELMTSAATELSFNLCRFDGRDRRGLVRHLPASSFNNDILTLSFAGASDLNLS